MARYKRGSRKPKQPRVKRTKEEWEAMKKENPDLEKGSYKLAVRSNEMFEKFYEGIGIVPEGEWDSFLDTLRTNLPATFRITGSRSQAQELLKIIKGQYFTKFLGKERNGVKLEPKSIPWYPEELAWQLDITKKEIKNDSTLKSLHGFLISETESGNISRQEAVSMIPPLLLDVQPHHKILDMCAAPGSKTAQLIEMLHSDENQPIPEGFVVANDMDNKRCYLMTHQVKRIQSPNCMIINHDARILPNMVTSLDEDAEFVKFDRVLCDVPCSGDGTMRKNPDIWSKWHVNAAYNLHRIQKKVLQRGLELLAVGGRLVYSTCSLNPVEDEAVILNIINLYDGAVELLDVSDKLPGLKYCKGTYSWKILAKNGSWYETEDQAPKQFKNNWDSSMYPPIITEAQNAKLERCIRILPHHQNTGAFFIAVLQKTRELPTHRGMATRPDPVINSNEEQKPNESEVEKGPFTMGVRLGSGLYVYARCNLCGVLLQGQSDYNSHKGGKKHLMALKDSEKKESKKKFTDAATETSNTDSIKDSKPEYTEKVGTDIKVKDEPGTQNVAQSEIGPSENTEKVSTDIKVKDEPGIANVAQSETEPLGEGSPNSTDTQNINADIKVETPSANGDAGAMDKSADNVKSEQEGQQDTNTGEPPRKKARQDNADEGEIKVRMQGHKEDPFYFCSKEDPIWPQIKKFYNISEDLNLEQIMYRNMKRILYFVSQPIRRLVLANCHKVKFINLGVKCFSNAPSPLVPDCDYRLSQEGLLAVEKYVGSRRVCLTKQDLITILSQENPFICKLSAKAQDDVYSMGPGSALFYFKPNESDPEPAVDIAFCGWRGKTSVRSFVGKDERSHYLRLCGLELTDIQARVQAEKIVKGLAPGVSGTDTPVGVASGDEEEVKQWNEGQEAPRGMEEDETEDQDSQSSKGVEGTG